MRRLSLFIFSIILFFGCQPSLKKEPSTTEKSFINFPLLYVVKENVNLRALPKAGSDRLATLVDGTAIRVSDNKNGWYRVHTDDGKQGWLRSDLAGPRELSLTRMASAFNDSIMPAFGGELFFDKKDLFKVIYLKLEPPFYNSISKAQKKATKIATAYQEKVYSGKLEVRIMRPETDAFFTKVTLPAKGMSSVPLPILDYGRLFALNEHHKSVTIRIAVPDSIPDSKLLKAARRISARYDYPFIRAEIYMISDNPGGLSYLRAGSVDAPDQRVCRLYYLEDANGEDYRFRFCDR